MPDKLRTTASELKLMIEERLRASHPDCERAEVNEVEATPPAFNLATPGGLDEDPFVAYVRSVALPILPTARAISITVSEPAPK